ncbi:MAG: hypothetical protein KDA29_13300 [Phycisphaerales bacterium]|nr:hypothetical protein [Phycisphaerales bacterium]
MLKIIQYGLIASATSIACAEVIRPELEVLVVQAGTEVSVLWKLEQSSIPLFGYSLDLNIVPDAGGVRQGSVAVNTERTNFFDSQNLISAGGGTRDSFFSVILPDATGGAFLSTNASDTNSAFVAELGVNDVLAEMYFDISADAEGTFVFELGNATALSDADGIAVGFSAVSLSIVVVPAPSTLPMACLLFGYTRVRRCS